MPSSDETPVERVKLRLNLNVSTVNALLSILPSGRLKNHKRVQSIGPFLDSIASTLVHLAHHVRVFPHRKRKKLTIEQVRAMRASDEPLKCLAMENGVSIQTASLIRQRKSWRWVE